MYALLLLDFNGPFGGPHGGLGHFPGFFFCGPILFWTLLLGFILVRTLSRHTARPTAPHPTAPPPDSPPTAHSWPDLDPAPPIRQPADDGLVRKGKIEYF